MPGTEIHLRTNWQKKRATRQIWFYVRVTSGGRVLTSNWTWTSGSGCPRPDPDVPTSNALFTSAEPLCRQLESSRRRRARVGHGSGFPWISNNITTPTHANHGARVHGAVHRRRRGVIAAVFIVLVAVLCAYLVFHFTSSRYSASELHSTNSVARTCVHGESFCMHTISQNI